MSENDDILALKMQDQRIAKNFQDWMQTSGRWKELDRRLRERIQDDLLNVKTQDDAYRVAITAQHIPMILAMIEESLTH